MSIPIHPVLVHIPLVLLPTSFALAYYRIDPKLTYRLLTAALIVAVPAALAGAYDWSHITDPQAKRTANIHAALNFVALLLSFYLWTKYKKQVRFTGKIEYLIVGILLISGYLGHVLVYKDKVKCG